MTHNDLDPIERAILPVLRHFLHAFQEPGSLSWRIGFATAVGTWGEARGLAIANAAQNFVAASLQARGVPIRYADPLDLNQRKELTLDEHAMLGVMTQMRNDNSAAARLQIEALIGSQIRANVIRTGLVLASHFQSQTQPRAQVKAPALKAVV